MNYLNKMHVGDIVISKTGSIGYVCLINYEEDFFEWTLVRDDKGSVPPWGIIYHLSEDDISLRITQIGGRKIEPLIPDKCADCNRDYDTDDRLDALNTNLLTLIEKLDQIIKED